MATHKLVVILEKPLNDAKFLLLKQTPPPKFNDIHGAQSSHNIDLTKFDVQLALNGVLENLGLQVSDAEDWSLFKHVEEAEFGLGFPVNTVFVMGKLLDGNHNFLID